MHINFSYVHVSISFYVRIHMYVDIKVLYLLCQHLLVPASFLRGKIIINMISVHPYVFYLQPYSGKISIKLLLILLDPDLRISWVYVQDS